LHSVSSPYFSLNAAQSVIRSSGGLNALKQPFRLVFFLFICACFSHFLETVVPLPKSTRARSSLLHAGGSTKTQ
jgi:hypothetical protein